MSDKKHVEKKNQTENCIMAITTLNLKVNESQKKVYENE
jgi:hypothetical protein